MSIVVRNGFKGVSRELFESWKLVSIMELRGLDFKDILGKLEILNWELSFCLILLVLVLVMIILFCKIFVSCKFFWWYIGK